MQTFECVTLCLIVLACILFQQTGVFRRGMTGPFAANLYGLGRFFWEFFRYNTPEMRNFLFGMTLWQLFCLLVLVVSAVWLAILYRTQPCEPLPKRKLYRMIEEKLPGKKRKRSAASRKRQSAGRKKKKSAAKRSRKKHR